MQHEFVKLWRGSLLRKRPVVAAAAAVTAGALSFLAATPAQATEYHSALKIHGVQYDAPGRDSNSCSSGNTDEEYLTIKNYSSSATINLKGYVVKDATGNRFTFTASHYLQPGDYVKLRGGHGTDSDTYNVVYRDNCNFMWNNDRDTIYLYKPSGSRSDVHSYTKSGSDSDGNGYIRYHS
ncbi:MULTISPECIES: lamin tail domain-containing protein [unclassified Streptomyces]|uniref:lamin tail domain-containing protein n=1 Tax=Streptomyces sp. SceaMP-e96 TaxID=1100824 RepID=UPI00159F1B96